MTLDSDNIIVYADIRKTVCVRVANSAEERRRTTRRPFDDRSRHFIDVQLHLAAGVSAASEPQQLGGGRRLPGGGDGVPALAHSAQRALRPHAAAAAAEDARTTREGHRRTQDQSHSARVSVLEISLL